MWYDIVLNIGFVPIHSVNNFDVSYILEVGGGENQGEGEERRTLI